MVTVLEGCTTEEQGSAVFILWAKGLNVKDIHIKYFMFTGSGCRVKRFTTESR
jgi:hypothetical protein